MEKSPKDINKEHVLAAVARIEKEKIELIPSKKWAVEINGKKYPPKEVMRYAHQEMDGKKIWNYSGGSSTNNFLASMGFKTIRLNNDPVQYMVDKYKEYIKTGGLKNELYKWKLLGEFKGRPNVKAADFGDEIKSINFSNLIYPVGKTVINNIAKDEPEKYRKCFQELYDEDEKLSKRIQQFSNNVAIIYKNMVSDKKLQVYHDERTISTFLTFHDPEKYCFYKYSYYQKYCKILGIKPKNTGQKYEHYLELIEDFILDYIVDDTELISLVNSNLKKEFFDDNSHKILAQDILYQSLDVKIENPKKYWLYAPGENTNKWEEFYEKGIMAIAWPELGDLKKYKTPKEIEKELLKHHPEKKRSFNDALANFEFANKMSVGDIVIVKKGSGLLLGYGVVESDYYYDQKEELYTAKRKVSWIKKGEWDPEHSLVQKTLTDITDYPTEHPGYENYYERLMVTMGEERDMNNKDKTYYEELNKFLLQAESTDLKTSDYLKIYKGLKVKVSFGKGNVSKVPWIAFLNDIDHVQEGIYPVYLYYRDKKLLILAYGISETNIPARSWEIENKKTIYQYFLENNLGKPDRYGSSFIYKVYDLSQDIKEDSINFDLNTLLNFYKSNSATKSDIRIIENINHQNFYEDAKSSGLFFNNDIFLRFVASLITKPFLILTGLSGSGKTKLAQAFAMWMCENNEQYCIVPVGADWTNREPLLGFPNALKEKEYVKPDNRVLDLIISANNDPSRPYFLILDEMNLSHVERYFADFLSVMESGNNILLHSGEENWGIIPPRLGFPDNLFILGTVNIDETTYMFSPKVLDRANVIEFRVTDEEMETYLDNAGPVSLEKLSGAGAGMAGDFLAIARDKSIKTKYRDKIHETMMLFFKELKKTGAEFGYRTASEILRFAAVVNIIEPEWGERDIIDAAIMQKLLPKVHGSRKKLEPVLKTLGMLCLENDQEFEKYVKDDAEINYSDSSEIKYPLSLEKIVRMYKNLLSNGFTSFAEA